MIKKAREYFSAKHRRKKLELQLKAELLETMCTLCLYLQSEGHFGRNRYGEYFGSHFNQLKDFSVMYRTEAQAEERLEVRWYGTK